MKKFHITITDNETGKTLHDCDTGAIIGAFQESEDVTAAIGLTNCDALTLLQTVNAAKRAADKILEDDPLCALLAPLIDKLSEEKDTEATEDTENN